MNITKLPNDIHGYITSYLDVNNINNFEISIVHVFMINNNDSINILSLLYQNS